MGEANNDGGGAGKACSHVRLVSEGGAEAPEAQRARFWSPEQMVASCITPQQMDNFRAYNNVCMTLPTNDRYAFSVPLEHAADLDEGVIPQSLLREFETNNAPLSGAARLLVQHAGRVWFIVDLDKKYSVRMVPTGLLVYSETL